MADDDDSINRAFLSTISGAVLFFVIIFLIHASLLGWADLSPEATNESLNSTNIGEIESASHGISVYPLGENWPFNNTIPPFLTIGTVALLTAVGGYFSSLYWSRRYAIASTTLLHAVVIGLELYSGIGSVTKQGSAFPLSIKLAGIFYFAFVAVLTAVYTQKLVPNWTRNQNVDVSLYVSNQWRFAQTALTAAFVGILGTAFPLVLELTNVLGIIPYVLTFILFTTPPLSVALFYLLRIRNIERARRPLYS